MNLDEMRQLDAVKTYKELEEAKAEIERLRKANFQLREGAEEQKQRIKRLDEFVDQLTNPKFTRDDLPKEALLQRIKRLEEALGLVLKMQNDWLEMQDDGYAGAYYAFVKGNDSEWEEIIKAKEAKP